MSSSQENLNECVVVFSGGTDSMCTAALMAEKYKVIHLLTYYDYATKNEPFPFENVERLRKHFPNVTWLYKTINTDNIIKFFSYRAFLADTFRFGLYNIMTPAFSTLSWHCRTIAYCLEHKVFDVYDGMTNEMIQLPGHMSTVIEQLQRFYKKFGITFESPVRDWSVPEDQNVLDRVIVDQHGFLFPSEESNQVKTTGEYLFQKGIFPHPNIKGSRLDRQMQHDCYPFVLYNILTYWLFLNFISYESFSEKVALFVAKKLDRISPLLISFGETFHSSLFAPEEKHGTF